ncbi:MAG: histidine phosphatase family protein [Spirochaetes bacterium]|nr:histidine phosphatase family protein [Spirochaetota bacterium]
MKKPERIFIIRHGESEANIDRNIYSKLHNYQIPLTELGKEQARECGRILKEKLVSENIFFYLSPYLRTKQTFECIVSQLGRCKYRFREEPRIREQDFGNPQDQFVDLSLDPDFNKCGAFFYRFPNGECGADVYDRVTTFFSTLHRNFSKKNYPENVVIITHGMLMRLFIMRWYHLSVEEFGKFKNPDNCYICTMKLENDKYKLEEEFPRYT